MTRKEKALDYFSRGFHCSQAVLASCADLCSLTEEQALKITDRAEELALELERQEKERRESERGQNGDSNKPSPEDGEQPKE